MTDKSHEFWELFMIYKTWLDTHATSFDEAKQLIDKDAFLVDELLWTDCIDAAQADEMKNVLPELKQALYPAVKNSFADP